MHNYHDEHGQLPPAVVYGEDGKPLLSWRVLVLPNIEEGELYRQFKLNEPWDSPHNIQLLPHMPHTYATLPSLQRNLPPFHTICHVFVGKGTPFEGTQGLNLKKDFPRGTSNTILLIEAGKPVPWTKPDELIHYPDGALPELKGIGGSSFRVALADGSVRHVDLSKMSQNTFRTAIMRIGNEPLGPDW
jgi:hypothetical protein